ncbi:MAG: RNA polymerase sigma factor [Chloroflexi bacterium]|nr:RNA polymerase sigma factor [Chloroflexota bacterium]
MAGSKVPVCNEADFELLIEGYQTRIAKYVYNQVKHVEDTQDLTQEVFLRAFKAQEQLRSSQALVSWLFSIAVNVVRDYYRQKQKTIPIASVQWADTAQWVDPPSELLEEDDLVGRALARLPQDTAACLLLHEVEGFTAREIAAILNIRPDAARQRIVRARRAFKQTYQGLSHEGQP